MNVQNGNAEGQYKLGLAYETGGNGIKKDYNEAVKWFRKAAEQEYAEAQFRLGLAYEDGRKGVAKDYAEAVKWFCKAAEQEYAEAQYNLGLAYEDGKGVAKDYTEAVKWFRKAAEQGHAGAKAVLEGKNIELPSGTIVTLVKIEAGSFEMSAKDGENESDEVPHRATLTKDFYLGQTEVTQAQWRAVMGTDPSEFKGDDFPVEQVSWYDAMEFCDKLNTMGKAPKGWMFILPTETQWEYAARGGKKSKGYKYSGSNNIDEVAWYAQNSSVSHALGETHPVGQKKENELGLYDMSGNVHEWCLDDWNADSSKQKAEFKRGNDQDGSYRVARGGSWFDYYGAKHCRSSTRAYWEPVARGSFHGFRIALVLCESD